MTINFTHTGEKKQKTQDSICKYFCQEIKLAIKCSRLKGNDSWAVMQQDDSPTVKKKKNEDNCIKVTFMILMIFLCL